MFQYFRDLIGTREIENYEIINLIRSININDLVNDVHLRTYYIQDGETADVIAQKLYGDKDLYWVVYMSAGIKDPFYDWPMNQSVLRDYFKWLVSEGELTGTSGEWNTLKSENDTKKTINILKEVYIDDLIYLIEQRLG